MKYTIGSIRNATTAQIEQWGGLPAGSIKKIVLHPDGRMEIECTEDIPGNRLESLGSRWGVLVEKVV